MITKPVEVKALDNYSIFVRFPDGVQGTIDLKHLAHKGVFCAWDKDDLFAQVRIDDSGSIMWNEEIDICSNNVYLQLKGISFEQWRDKYATN